MSLRGWHSDIGWLLCRLWLLAWGVWQRQCHSVRCQDFRCSTRSWWWRVGGCCKWSAELWRTWYRLTHGGCCDVSGCNLRLFIETETVIWPSCVKTSEVMARPLTQTVTCVGYYGVPDVILRWLTEGDMRQLDHKILGTDNSGWLLWRSWLGVRVRHLTQAGHAAVAVTIPDKTVWGCVTCCHYCEESRCSFEELDINRNLKQVLWHQMSAWGTWQGHSSCCEEYRCSRETLGADSDT